MHRPFLTFGGGQAARAFNSELDFNKNDEVSKRRQLTASDALLKDNLLANVLFDEILHPFDVFELLSAFRDHFFVPWTTATNLAIVHVHVALATIFAFDVRESFLSNFTELFNARAHVETWKRTGCKYTQYKVLFKIGVKNIV